MDKDVIARAMRCVTRHGISVSEFVEAHLATIARPFRQRRADPPILRSLPGAIKNVDLEDYRRHLGAKYR